MDLSNIDITDISPFSFSKYRNLRALNMSNNYNFHFPEHSMFLVSHNIRYYFCNNCGIKVIYEETFKGLPILSTIELKGNEIQVIMPEAFNCLPQISILNLEYNRLKTFNLKGFLKFPPSFHTLTMNNNKDFKLPVNKTFLNSARLTSFECNFCNIQEIYNQSFTLVPEIVNIELKNNNMNRIDFNSFESNTKLDYICLDNNQLSEKNFNFISKSLQQVYCSNCSFTKIKENTFSNFQNLIKLEMRNNTISLIEENSFKNNPELKLIDLGSNQLQEFHANLIKDAKNLKKLIIDARDLCPKYPIKELNFFYENRKLSGTDFNFEIMNPDFHENVLHKNCPLKIQFSNDGTTIDISNKNITYIDPYFFESHIKILLMNGNKKFKFPSKKPVFHIDHLEEYRCNSCGIEQIYSDTFEKLPSLIKIELRNNGMKTIAYTAFRKNLNLQDLYLSDNSLSFLKIDGNKKLCHLDVSKNIDINEISESNSLQILNMSYCGIKDLISYTNLANLHILDLSFNQITSIDEQIFEGNLQELYLDSNRIEKFPAKFLENNKLTKLCLDNNLIKYEYSDDLVLLKEIYNKKNFRSHQRCLGSQNNNIGKFEDKIPERKIFTIAPTTTTTAPIKMFTTKAYDSTINIVDIIKLNESTDKTFEAELVDSQKNHDDETDFQPSTDPQLDTNENHPKMENLKNSEDTYGSSYGSKSTSNSLSLVCMVLGLSLIYTFE